MKLTDANRHLMLLLIVERLRELTGMWVDVPYLSVDRDAKYFGLCPGNVTRVELKLDVKEVGVLHQSILVDNDLAGIYLYGPLDYLLTEVRRHMWETARLINERRGEGNHAD